MDYLNEYKKKYGILNTDRFSWIRSHAPEGKKILDIGCCYGWTFQSYDHSNITSVDLDDYSHRVPNFVRANAQKLPFESGSFEIGVIGEILEHQSTLEDSQKVLSEALRVAETVLLTVPNEYFWDDTTDKFKTFADELRENNNDMTDKAKFTAKFAKDIYTEDNYEHIFHHHSFSPEGIEDLIKSVTDRDYYIFILPKDGDPSIGAAGTTAAIIQ